MRRSKAPPLGRNFVANPLPSPTPIPYRGGWGVTLIGALQIRGNTPMRCTKQYLCACLRLKQSKPGTGSITKVKNAENIRSQSRDKYQNNPQIKRMPRERVIYNADPNKAKEAACKQYSTNPEPKKKAARKQYSANPEPKKGAARKQYSNHPERKRLPYVYA